MFILLFVYCKIYWDNIYTPYVSAECCVGSYVIGDVAVMRATTTFWCQMIPVQEIRPWEIVQCARAFRIASFAIPRGTAGLLDLYLLEVL
jgi:hypothetical protein